MRWEAADHDNMDKKRREGGESVGGWRKRDRLRREGWKRRVSVSAMKVALTNQ